MRPIAAHSMFHTGLAHKGNDRLGAMMFEALVAPAALIGVNAGISGLGLGMPALRLGESLGIPGWIAFTAFAMALASWGFVRFGVKSMGAQGRSAADWLLVLMAATIAFPFITLGFDAFWMTFAGFCLSLVGLGTLVRVAVVSRKGAWAMAPSVLAMAMPAVLGFTILAMGWSPPFAAINAADTAPVPAHD